MHTLYGNCGKGNHIWNQKKHKHNRWKLSPTEGGYLIGKQKIKHMVKVL